MNHFMLFFGGGRGGGRGGFLHSKVEKKKKKKKLNGQSLCKQAVISWKSVLMPVLRVSLYEPA